jgi:alanine racemase
MTHFSDADAKRFGQDGIAHQLAVFNEATQDLPGERSHSNSAASLRYSANDLRTDWIRPGIAQYGSSTDYPEHDVTHWDLQPAMTLSSKIIATQDMAAGDSVGYGSAYVAEQPMRIGIVACGYADGYPRIAHGTNARGTPILVNGQRTRTVGRVSMDMITVDLSGIPNAGIGSEVTLWGRSSSGAVLSIDEVAVCAQTVGYELMCALAQRVPTVVDDSGI